MKYAHELQELMYGLHESITYMSFLKLKSSDFSSLNPIDVREGPSGALVLKCCWSHCQLTDNRKYCYCWRNREKGKKAMEKKMEKCQISPKQLSFLVESWRFCFDGMTIVCFWMVFRVHLCRS